VDAPFAGTPDQYGHKTVAEKDAHVEQFPYPKYKCEQCHPLDAPFRPSLFTHENPKYLGYKLVGKHAKLTCQKCHIYPEMHASHPHPRKGREMDCEGCHKPGDLHVPINIGYKKQALYRPMDTSCNSTQYCHQEGGRLNIHRGQFKGQKCDECHNEFGWKPTTFKHENPVYKGYKLEGKHAQVPCYKCHAGEARGAVNYKPIKYDVCETCHADIHKGKYAGQKCDECHTVKDWKDIIKKPGANNSVSGGGYK
jgi:hypothetical protein